MRTGMESVYTLLDIDRGVPEVWGSKYDVRELLRACYYAIDKKPLNEAKLSFVEKELLKIVLKKVKGTDLGASAERKRAHPVKSKFRRRLLMHKPPPCTRQASVCASSRQKNNGHPRKIGCPLFFATTAALTHAAVLLCKSIAK